MPKIFVFVALDGACSKFVPINRSISADVALKLRRSAFIEADYSGLLPTGLHLAEQFHGKEVNKFENWYEAEPGQETTRGTNVTWNEFKVNVKAFQVYESIFE